MEYQHPDLIKVMDQIKAILDANNVAATVILAMPEPDQEAPADFHMLTVHHIGTSFSCATVVDQFCCEKHGNIKGIQVEVKTKTPEEAAVIIKRTAGMFKALKDASLAAHVHCAKSMVGIDKMVEAIAAKQRLTGKQNMN